MYGLDELMRDMTLPPRRPPPVGRHATQLDIDGVLVDVTYNLVGWNTPATEIEPAEAEYAELITAHVGGVDVMPLEQRLNLDCELQLAVMQS
jgi:hypothetical protein